MAIILTGSLTRISTRVPTLRSLALGVASAGVLAASWCAAPDALAQDKPRRVIAMIVGNGAAGQKADYGDRLVEFRDKIFKYGDDTVLLHETDPNASELTGLATEFHRQAASADVAIVYFSGQTVHDASGRNYLVPSGWDGATASLIDFGKLVDHAGRAKSGAVLFIDTPSDTRRPVGTPGFNPGLVGLGQQGGAGKVQIAYAPAGDRDVKPLAMLDTLLKSTVGSSLKLVRLAALAQEDISLESGGHYVPRVTRATHDLPELTAMSDDALENKKQRCTAERQRDSSDSTVANSGEPELKTASFGSRSLSASPPVSRRYCPLFTAPPPSPQKPDKTAVPKRPNEKVTEPEEKAQRSRGDQPRKVAQSEPKSESRSESPRQPSYRQPPSSTSPGSSAARAAAGSVPGSF